MYKIMNAYLLGEGEWKKSCFELKMRRKTKQNRTIIKISYFQIDNLQDRENI